LLIVSPLVETHILPGKFYGQVSSRLHRNDDSSYKTRHQLYHIWDRLFLDVV
jgi:hypothetical protein